MIEALKQLNQGKNLEECVDVDAMLRYLAANVFVVNMDSYFSNMAHNYYLYEEDGRLTMLPWDYNLAFGGFQTGGSSSAINFPIDTPVSGVEMSERPMIAQLLAVEEYREQYHDYLQQLVTGYVQSGRFVDTVDYLDMLIGEKVQTDPSAFYDYDQYLEAKEMLKDFAELRAASIAGQKSSGKIPALCWIVPALI